MSENNNIQNLKDEFGDKLLDHDYDGITELDNPAPKWIMALFYITIAFSVFYGGYYFWFGLGAQQDQEYIEASKRYEEKYKSNANKVEIVLLTDEASLSEGAQIYKDMNCAACHGANGEGNAIGPNLADENWIYGCEIEEVVDVIKNGRVEKGMTAFGKQLTDDKILKVSSYLLQTMRGSNPANAKAPQGDICN